MAYCVAGIASCFIATFASVAATKGIYAYNANIKTQRDMVVPCWSKVA
jgi:uncharacterized OsmC-like protein